MAKQVAVIIRFTGDPDDLLERLERTRRLWIDDQEPDYERPAFYAACKTDDGIAIVSLGERDRAPGVRSGITRPHRGGRPRPTRSHRADADRQAGLGLTAKLRCVTKEASAMSRRGARSGRESPAAWFCWGKKWGKNPHRFQPIST